VLLPLLLTSTCQHAQQTELSPLLHKARVQACKQSPHQSCTRCMQTKPPATLHKVHAKARGRHHVLVSWLMRCPGTQAAGILLSDGRAVRAGLEGLQHCFLMPCRPAPACHLQQQQAQGVHVQGVVRVVQSVPVQLLSHLGGFYAYAAPAHAPSCISLMPRAVLITTAVGNAT